MLCVFDPTIWHFIDATVGLKEESTIIFNSRMSADELKDILCNGTYPSKLSIHEYRLFSFDATGLAMDIIGRPITNTTMMGAFSAATGLLPMDKVIEVIKENFGKLGETNIKAAEKAYKLIKKQNQAASDRKQEKNA